MDGNIAYEDGSVTLSVMNYVPEVLHDCCSFLQGHTGDDVEFFVFQQVSEGYDRVSVDGGVSRRLTDVQDWSPVGKPCEAPAATAAVVEARLGEMKLPEGFWTESYCHAVLQGIGKFNVAYSVLGRVNGCGNR